MKAPETLRELLQQSPWKTNHACLHWSLVFIRETLLITIMMWSHTNKTQTMSAHIYLTSVYFCCHLVYVYPKHIFTIHVPWACSFPVSTMTGSKFIMYTWLVYGCMSPCAPCVHASIRSYWPMVKWVSQYFWRAIIRFTYHAVSTNCRMCDRTRQGYAWTHKFEVHWHDIFQAPCQPILVQNLFWAFVEPLFSRSTSFW